VSRFLIVRLGSLGDVVHAIPAAAALRAHAPDAAIDWVVDPRYAAVLRLVRGLDRTIAFDTRETGTIMGWPSIRGLRAARYDAVIDLQGLLKSALLARVTGSSRRIGFPRAHLREPMARVFYTDTPDPGSSPHVIFKNLALLAPLGVRAPRLEFPLDLPPSAAADEVASGAGDDGYALINPGAAWPNKRWPAERFGAVAASIRERLGISLVVLWGPGEESLASAVVTAAGGAARMAPATTVTDLFALATRARLMVSGDTGPLHIAAAVGTPIVALFGPTRPERNGPWSAEDVSLSRNSTCACHYERRCRRGAPCIDEIGVHEVMAAVERRLALASPKPAGGGGAHG
jgi:lipopolysaccharide heptosyltransferase I